MLGAVSGIVIKDGHIGFTIEIDPKDKEQSRCGSRAWQKRPFWRLTGVVSNGNADRASGRSNYAAKR
jgi:hypothetical protein